MFGIRGFRFYGGLLSAICIVLFCFFVHGLHAATLTDVYNQPSSLTISDGSNHKFVFLTPSGLSEGETIQIVFPSGFDLSLITENDVDVEDDGADINTASTCGGAEQMSVEVSSTTLILTMCAGDGGNIAPGSEVIVEIGANASYAGSGQNRIVNPSEVATYFINISGTFGDSGSVPVPIVEDGDALIGGTVSGPNNGSGGGGGGGGGGGEEEPPDEEPVDEEPPVEEPHEEVPQENENPPTDEEPGTDSGPGTGSETDSGGNSGSEDLGSGSSGSPNPPTDEEPEEDNEGRTIDVTVLTARGGIVLSEIGGAVSILSGIPLQLELSVVDSSEVALITASYNGTPLAFVPVFVGEFATTIVPGGAGTLSVTVRYSNGYEVSDSVAFKTVGYGTVSSEGTPVSGAVAIVFSDALGGAQWPAGNYGQSNPVLTSTSGTLGWYVPNGSYRVTVGKDGYRDAEKSISVTNNILTPSFLLAAVPVIPSEVSDEEPADTKPETVIPRAIENTVVAVGKVLESVKNIPEVQTAATISEPVVVATTVTSAVVLASSFNLLPYLQYLFTAPVLFIARRRRQEFGTVYHAYTKVPLDLAIVRLYDSENRLVRTMVTDQEGRYFFRANPGVYSLHVTKQNFVFPSEYLKGVKDDGKFLDLYTGQRIEVTESDAVLNANIPLDPMNEEKVTSPRSLIFMRFLRVFQNVIALAGLGLSVFVFAIQTSVLTGVLALLQAVIYLVTRILTRPKKKKGWGIVYEQTTEKPLANAVVRLFEPKFNKLIESTVTDRYGRYAFLAGPNEYYVTFEKPGYQRKEVKPIDFTAKNEPSLISIDVPLQKGV